ncbi:sugar ABC transporter permease [Spirochaetia bacterium]|nr:sugar ABC transporter permease [Spirochaetia bacterium]
MGQIKKVKSSDELWGYFFIAPQFIGLLLFVVVPVIQSLGISFTSWDLLSKPVFTGIDNYKKVLSNPLTYKVFIHTLQFIGGFIVLTTILSLLAALGLSNKLRGHTIFRSVFFLPNITSSVAVSLVWLWLFNPEMGLVNIVLMFFGVENPPGWYVSLQWAMPTIILMAVWQGIGYFMIIFLAGLNGISDTYYEAASIDGAGKVYCFFKITLPLLTPTLFFVLTMMLINCFQVFNEVYMLTGGGPAQSTRTIVFEIYETAFRHYKMGEAAVLAWFLFIIIFTVTILQFNLSKKWVNYDT